MGENTSLILSGGGFVISLDFELHYGISDTRSLNAYKCNLQNTPQAVQGILHLFKEYDIHATWAIVGLLFAVDKDEVIDSLPSSLPTYNNRVLSNYRILRDIGLNIEEDPYHYAWPLIATIGNTPNQEIGTHTFSHYYCLENGQTIDQFRADLVAALRIAQKRGIEIQSIVFPRNQYNADYLRVCKSLGIVTYRGNESHWLYTPRNRAQENSIRRAGRLLDAYLPVSGYHSYLPKSGINDLPICISASRFLRPHSPKLSFADRLRLRRITEEMTFASEQNKIYHLWWHPHNFGRNISPNLYFLAEILSHFHSLRSKNKMRSLTMVEAAKFCCNGR